MHICPPSAHLAGPHGLDVLALVVPDVDEDVVKVPVGHTADMSGLLSASKAPLHAAAAAGEHDTVVLKQGRRTCTYDS